MFVILSWIVYGLIVGLLAKAIHPGEDSVGFIPTVGIGIAGSYIGGFINYLLGGGSAFTTSGLLMGTIGGVVFCWLYRRYRLSQFFKAQGRMPR